MGMSTVRRGPKTSKSVLSIVSLGLSLELDISVLCNIENNVHLNFFTLAAYNITHWIVEP